MLLIIYIAIFNDQCFYYNFKLVEKVVCTWIIPNTSANQLKAFFIRSLFRLNNVVFIILSNTSSKTIFTNSGTSCLDMSQIIFARYNLIADANLTLKIAYQTV